MRRTCGIALLAVSGIVALLAFLAATFLQAGRVLTLQARTGRDQRLVETAAESGLEYAAARLTRGWPGPVWTPTDANRGDDWAARGVPGLNPSYSHGEPWIDRAAGTAGVFDPGEKYSDRDGDGRFSAFSGRVRGQTAGTPGLTFSLRIDSPCGKIPVNAGRLVPPYLNNPNLNMGLNRLLCNLGAILIPATPDTETRIGRIDKPGGIGEPILISRLGEHLISRRPVGGYASLDEIRTTLKAIGYSSAECDVLLPFLDLGPYETPDESAPPGVVQAVSINLMTAERDLLQAAWMYLSANQTQILQFLPGFSAPYGNPLASPRRSGGSLTFKGTGKVMIYPDEAKELADRAIQFRTGPHAASWLAFREDLTAHASSIFSHDLLMLAAGSREAAAWGRAKTDLAFFAAAALDLPENAPFSNQTHWEIGTDPSLPLVDRPFPWIDLGFFSGSPFRTVANLNPLTLQWTGPPTTPYGGSGPTIWPIGLTLAPPERFEIRSAGRHPGGASSAASAMLKAYDRVEFTSQEDFENLSGAPTLLARRSIRTDLSLPADQRRPPFDDPVPGEPLPAPHPWTVTLPKYNPRGLSVSPSPNHYPRHGGAVALAARACSNLGALQYWPLTESFTVSVPPATLSNFLLPASQGWTFPSLGSGSGPWFSSGILSTPTMIPAVFDCPGIPPSPGRVKNLSFELWTKVRPLSGAGNSLLKLTGRFGNTPGMANPQNSGTFTLTMVTVNDPARGIGSKYVFDIEWPSFTPLSAGPLGPTWSPAIGFVPIHDPQNLRECPDADHLVVTLQDSSGYLYVDLYANGVKIGDNRTAPYPSIPAPDRIVRLDVNDADELRFYDYTLNAGDVQRLYDLGRYVRPMTGPAPKIPSFRSPRYTFDRPARPFLTNWTGIPARDKTGTERTRIEIVFHGYDANGAPVPGSPFPLSGTRDLSDLTVLGPVHSFEYEVFFVNNDHLDPDNTAPLYQTPFFESIWIGLRRGRTGWVRRPL